MSVKGITVTASEEEDRVRQEEQQLRVTLECKGPYRFI
jgi:hypothetical protein